MKKILLILSILTVIAAIVAWIRYGGGQAYPDLSSSPIFDESAIEEVLAYPEPIGSVAVSADGRLFFTVHPEARPQGNRLLEYVDGAALPFPNVESQLDLFDTVLGLAIDQQNRLWTIDHGNHGLRTARLLAFDLDSGSLIHDQRFDADIAPAGSLLQDIQVSADGLTVVVADASYWRKRPALIIYDVNSGTSRRTLENHESVAAENYTIRNQDKEMSFLGGIVNLRGGIGGMAMGSEWLYYGALTGAGLYRILLSDVQDISLASTELAARVERYATKPLGDGLSIDIDGNVYVTDVEHNAVYAVGTDREVKTLIRSDRIRWPDALSLGPDGWIYVADSALPELIMQSREHIEAQRPYKVFRFQPGEEDVPGQ
jgi:sugar lactone lactonase YvrE